MGERHASDQRDAPTLDDLQRLADEAFAALPEAFRTLCDGMVIRVVDFPDAETLDEMGAESRFDLLGLFRGVGLAQSGGAPAAVSGQMPNMIWLYRRPLLAYWGERDDTLEAIVAHVLIHEIGHHFGLSDGDMEAIDRGGAA